MSYQTNRNWYYYLNGRDLHLYQLSNYGNVTVVAGKRVRLPESPYGNYLVYPDEDIADGLRIEYTHLDDPFISEAIEDTNVKASGTDIEFSATVLTGAGTNDGFAIGDRVRIIGSASNDGDYTSTNEDDNTLTFPSATFTTETAGESIIVYQIPLEDITPDETNHINLNRLLSLSIVDYLKAQLSDVKGDVQMKEYYMREFWKKIGDNDSNRRKIVMSFPMGSYAVR